MVFPQKFFVFHCICHCTRIFHLSYANLFLMKTCFKKLTFLSRELNRITRSTASENPLKQTLCYLENFSKLCLCQQLFVNKDFCMKTGMYNIFETKNAMTLIKTVLESHSANTTKYLP